MRYREAFSLYKRTMTSGKHVYYYMTYDELGNRVCGHSTGKLTKTEARNYCHRLLREGRLVPERGKVPTFEEFAKGWWEWGTCPYLLRRQARRAITEAYADSSKSTLKNHLLPKWGKMRLDQINEFLIDEWLISFKAKGLANKSANCYLKVLSVMLGEAVRRKILKVNPVQLVAKLKLDPHEVEILTPAEVRKIFPQDWREVWGDYETYLVNKVAACTGLRISEVLGLKGEFLFDGYLAVTAQFNNYGYVDTKTHKARNVPLPNILEKELAVLVFALPGKDKPIARKIVLQEYYNALEKIGIGKAEREKRHLNFHSWRHFFNTTLRMANVADSKVMAVTGHSSIQMTNHYTHFKNTEFTDVRKVQEDLLGDGTITAVAAAEKSEQVRSAP